MKNDRSNRYLTLQIYRLVSNVVNERTLSDGFKFFWENY